jgi:hypothetical protein
MVVVLCAATAAPIAAANASSGPRPGIKVSTAAAGSTSSSHVRRHNIAANPNYFELCALRGRNDSRCIAAELAAIRHARRHDHHITKRAVILPDNYTKLSVAEQTFVVMNLERVDRGIRPIQGLVPRLSLVSRLAAALQTDPLISTLVARLLGIGEWRSVWAGDLGPLAADYDWMYNDGYSASGSINIACRRPTARGCWGHRRNILSRFAGFTRVVAGAGTAQPVGRSIAAVTAGIRGRAPHYSYTWRQALNHGANGHRVVARAGT